MISTPRAPCPPPPLASHYALDRHDDGDLPPIATVCYRADSSTLSSNSVSTMMLASTYEDSLLG